MQTQNPIEIVSQSLQKKRNFDGKTCDAIETLARRLEKLKAMSPLFENVSFSQQLESFARDHAAVGV